MWTCSRSRANIRGRRVCRGRIHLVRRRRWLHWWSIRRFDWYFNWFCNRTKCISTKLWISRMLRITNYYNCWRWWRNTSSSTRTWTLTRTRITWRRSCLTRGRRWSCSIWRRRGWSRANTRWWQNCWRRRNYLRRSCWGCWRVRRGRSRGRSWSRANTRWW